MANLFPGHPHQQLSLLPLGAFYRRRIDKHLPAVKPPIDTYHQVPDLPRLVVEENVVERAQPAGGPFPFEDRAVHVSCSHHHIANAPFSSRPPTLPRRAIGILCVHCKLGKRGATCEKWC